MHKELLRNAPKAKRDLRKRLRVVSRQRWLLLMTLPALVVLLLFHYYPIYGLQIAFKNYNMGLGIWGSKWVGLKWFNTFLSNPFAPRLIRNTLLLGVYSLIWSFPLPIIFSVLLNELESNKIRRSVQTISYLPHFLSTVVVVGLVKEVFASDGVVNNIIVNWFGREPNMFLTNSSVFRSLFIGSGIWQEMGWNSIIYLAALSGIDFGLYEAAYIDGAKRWQRIFHITLPGIFPTITILLILNAGRMLSMDYQKVLLMYNEQVYETADIIATYTYREGIDRMRYSYSAAVELFMSVVSFGFLFVTNFIVKRLSDNSNSLW